MIYSMKNVFKYILILVLIMLGNVGHSQCDPEFWVRNDATTTTVTNRYILTPAINLRGGQIWNKAFVNLDSNKLIGKDISIDFNNKSFQEGNEPRLSGVTISADKNQTLRKADIFQFSSNLLKVRVRTKIKIEKTRPRKKWWTPKR